MRVHGVGDQRVLDRAQHRLVRGLVEHDLAALHRVAHGVLVGDRADARSGRCALHVRAEAGLEIVEHDDVVVRRATSASTRCEPMKPAPPVTRTLMVRDADASWSEHLREAAVQRVERRPGRGVDRARAGRDAVVDRRVGDDAVERDRDDRRARPGRSRPARAHSGVGSNGAPSSRTAASVASTAPTSPLLETARPIVRRPSRIRCTSSSSVSGNASTASRRARRPAVAVVGGARRPAPASARRARRPRARRR